jgi:short-subunit dehydrogenase
VSVVTSVKPTSVVAITGASSGIGRATALAWGARGARVVLSARNEAELANVAAEVRRAGGEAEIEAGDVTTEAHRRAIVARAERSFGGLDVLVNNAGRGYYAPARAIDAAELESLFALNVIAPLRLTQLALPLLERSRGAVVMLSSIAGVLVAPTMGAYAASKFALEALAMALRAEIASTGVRVVVVRPGPVDTPFRANAFARGAKAGVRPKAAGVQTPDDVARQIVRAVDKRQDVVETTLYVRGASMFARVLPPMFRAVTARMAGKHEE